MTTSAKFSPDETCADASATRDHAARHLSRFSPGTILRLHGPLGAGKSEWVRGLAQALGITGDIPSPTFTLCQPPPWRTSPPRTLGSLSTRKSPRLGLPRLARLSYHLRTRRYRMAGTLSGRVAEKYLRPANHTPARWIPPSVLDLMPKMPPARKNHRHP